MSLLGDIRKSVREAGEAQRRSASYLSIGIQIAVAFGLFVFGGYKLDEALGTKPLFLLIGAACALIVLFTILFRFVAKDTAAQRTDVSSKTTQTTKEAQ